MEKPKNFFNLKTFIYFIFICTLINSIIGYIQQEFIKELIKNQIDYHFEIQELRDSITNLNIKVTNLENKNKL